MKKIYSLFVLSLLFFNAHAQQIPNSGFENWQTVTYHTTSYEEPEPWVVGDFCASIGGKDTCQVYATKSSDANSGTYAMAVNSENGFPIAGLLDYADFGSHFPNSFEIMAKADLFTGDVLKVAVYFHNGTMFSDNPDVVGYGEAFSSQSLSSYTKLEGNILFPPNATYENVSLFVSFEKSEFSSGSTAIVDDFAFVYNVTGITNTTVSNKVLSATVLNDELTFLEEVSAYEILNVSGQTVLSGASRVVDVAGLPNGLYFVKAVKTDGQVFNYRVMKK